MPFWYLQFSQQTNKNFDFITMVPQVKLFLFIFLEELKTSKRHFEINWHLIQNQNIFHCILYRISLSIFCISVKRIMSMVFKASFHHINKEKYNMNFALFSFSFFLFFFLLIFLAGAYIPGINASKFRLPSLLQAVSSEWQYGLISFQRKDTKSDRFLAKNQHTQRKFLYSFNWHSSKLSKSAKIWLSKSNSYVKKWSITF